jgi:Tfp pilus assembly protein PilF
MTQQQMTIDQAIDLAMSHHGAGRLREAEAIYRQILGTAPNHPDALHLLGLVAYQAGQLEPAVDLIRRAIAANPRAAAYHANLGLVLIHLHRIDETIAAYRQAAALDPNVAEVHSNLGVMLHQKGQIDEAIASLRQALVVQPNYPEALLNLGNALHAAGQTDEAIESFRQALRLRPDYPEAMSNLGASLREKGEVDQAIVELQRAISLRPDYAEAYSNLGMALREKNQADACYAAYHRALELRPGYPEAQNNLGEALQYFGRIDEAISCYRQAIAFRSDYAEAHNNFGTALIEKKHLDEATSAFGEALKLSPESKFAHFNLGLIPLLRGDIQKGLPAIDRYWRTIRQYPFNCDKLRPQWDGSPLNGKRILLYAEQGFGDTIHFVRYVPMVEQLGGKVVLAVQPDLVSLIRSMKTRAQVISYASDQAPEFDTHYTLLLLPMALGTTLQNVPADVPYLFADQELSSQWRKRMPSDGLKVGIAWAGRPTYRNDRNRSTKLSTFAPLAQVEGVHYFSLQKGYAADQARTPPAGLNLTNWTDELKSFVDTAALIDNLDLVITIDTSIAHLAAAMGKPVWMMIAFMPDWRWMLDREDSPWYPTMRLFRQPAMGDWPPVLTKVVAALRELKTASGT